jgi:hypothetical protein
MRTKGMCWSVETIYDPRELPRVSTTGPGLDGVLQALTIWALGPDCLLLLVFNNNQYPLLTQI